MKKKIKLYIIIFITIIAISFTVLGIMFFSMISGILFTKDKLPISTTEFCTIMKNNGYIVEQDNKYDYEGVLDSKTIKNIYVANSRDGSYKIFFLEFSDISSAKNYI